MNKSNTPSVLSQLYHPQRTAATAKQRRTANTLYIVIFAILAVIGILLTVLSIIDMQDREIRNLSDTVGEDFDNQTIYYMDEAAVVDAYAFMESNITQGVVETNFLIYFLDSNNEGSYASLTLSKESPLWKSCNDYAEDVTAEMGSLIINGYFSCENMTALEKDVQSYYEEGYALYKPQLDGKRLEKNFLYLGATEEEAQSAHRKAASEHLLQGLFFAVGGAVAIGITLFLRKKIPADTPTATAPKEKADETIKLNGEEIQ